MALGDEPTWRASRPRVRQNWSAFGAGGHDDSRSIATIALAGQKSESLAAAGLAELLGPLAVGDRVWLILRRMDVGPDTVSVSMQCDVQWLKGGE